MFVNYKYFCHLFELDKVRLLRVVPIVNVIYRFNVLKTSLTQREMFTNKTAELQAWEELKGA